MNIQTQENGDQITYTLEGQLNTSTAPKLETEISEIGDNVNEVIFDVKNLKYISSAGLRILLKVAKQLKPKKGKVVVKKPNFTVLNILESTGLVDLVEVEQ